MRRSLPPYRPSSSSSSSPGGGGSSTSGAANGHQEWQDVVLPFSSFAFSYKGVAAGPQTAAAAAGAGSAGGVQHAFQPAEALSIGFSFAAGSELPEAGTFRLELHSVTALLDTALESEADPLAVLEGSGGGGAGARYRGPLSLRGRPG